MLSKYKRRSSIDVEVLPIWEGTTNIVSLDVLRHLNKEGGPRVLTAYKNEIASKISIAKSSAVLGMSAENTKTSVDFLLQFALNNSSDLETAARDFTMSLARCYIGMMQIY